MPAIQLSLRNQQLSHHLLWRRMLFLSACHNTLWELARGVYELIQCVSACDEWIHATHGCALVMSSCAVMCMTELFLEDATHNSIYSPQEWRPQPIKVWALMGLRSFRDSLVWLWTNYNKEDAFIQMLVSGLHATLGFPKAVACAPPPPQLRVYKGKEQKL